MGRRGGDRKPGWRGCSVGAWCRKGSGGDKAAETRGMGSPTFIPMWWIKIEWDTLGVKNPSARPNHTA